MRFFLESFEIPYFALVVLFLVSAISASWIAKYKFLPIVSITIFVASSILFLFTLGKDGFQDSYIALSSLLFLFALIGLSKFFSQQKRYDLQKTINLKKLNTGFNLNQTTVMFSVFFLISGVYGIYIDLDISIWIIMGIIFAGVTFLTFYLMKINFLKNKIAKTYINNSAGKAFTFYSFLFGFLVIELIWVASFLPANHLTIGAIALLLYCFFWNILRKRLKNQFSRKFFISNLMFFVIVTSIIFATSKWNLA